MSLPIHLFCAWEEIAERLRIVRRRVLLTDFDGTLAPLRPRPEQVWLARPVRQLLGRIARRGDVVGVISGRAIEDVRKRTGVHDIWYAGAHGFFLCDPGNRSFTLLNPNERERMRRALRALVPQLDALPGIRTEPKVATLAVHYRGARPPAREAACGILFRWLDREPGFALLDGKKIWELFPGSRVDKWSAVKFILDREGLEAGNRRTIVFYLGDDATDERVFEKLGAHTVLVGLRKGTAARFSLGSPREVYGFLRRWWEVGG